MLGRSILFQAEKHKDENSSMLQVIDYSYKKLASKLGAGIFLPTTGFANAMISSSIEARFEGPIFGFGSKVFNLAGSVIAYGVISAFFYGLICYFLSLLGVL